MADWRKIPLCEIDWRRVIGRGHVAGKLTWLCYPPQRTSTLDRGEWSSMTLGELANMGERWWKRFSGIGEVATDCIKDVIDRAAEGEDLRHPSAETPAPDAYVPKSEREKAKMEQEPAIYSHRRGGERWRRQ